MQLQNHRRLQSCDRPRHLENLVMRVLQHTDAGRLSIGTWRQPQYSRPGLPNMTPRASLLEMNGATAKAHEDAVTALRHKAAAMRPGCPQ